MEINGVKGILYDALYNPEMQMRMISRLANNEKIIINEDNEITFSAVPKLTEDPEAINTIKSKLLSVEQSNTSIVYGNSFFLKIYRTVDRNINPDLEITRFLTNEAKFEHVPAYIGSIEWTAGKGTMVLGMMQEFIPDNTDGWKYMLDRLANYNEKVLANKDLLKDPPKLKAVALNATPFEKLPQIAQELLEAPVAERITMLGTRTAEMHMALASSDDPMFRPEEFSLHYQRSLFSAFQSLVRKTFQTLSRTIKNLPDNVRPEAEEVLAMKDAVLQKLKLIYRKKLDVLKIRIHGDYHLGQTLFTGKDIMILDFEGEPARTYSERRLKRTAMKDVAGMIRSFHYAAYGSLFLNDGIRKEDNEALRPFVEQWYHYVSGIFMNAYLRVVKGSRLIPEEKEDLEILLQTYILEKAIYELNYELNNRPEWVIIPLRGIKAILNQQ